MAGPLSEFFSDFEFEEFLQALKDGGIMEYLFPFLLVYGIVFMASGQLKTFKEHKGVRTIFAISFGFVSISYPIGETGKTLGEFLAVLFPGATVVGVSLLALLIILAMFGVDSEFWKSIFQSYNEDTKKWSANFFSYIVGIAIIVIFALIITGFLGIDEDSNFLASLLYDPVLWIIVIFGIIFASITGPGQKNNKDENQTTTTTTSKGGGSI